MERKECTEKVGSAEMYITYKKGVTMAEKFFDWHRGLFRNCPRGGGEVVWKINHRSGPLNFKA